MQMSGSVIGAELDPYVRILSINGGGARCWSALVILEAIMKKVARDDDQEPRPCEYFHLIIGSEWGGILAILLGRFRLNVRECRDHLAQVKFPYDFGLLRIIPGLSRLRSRYYRRLFKEWAKEQSVEGDKNMPFYDTRLTTYHARTAVIASDPTSLATPKIFRSYRSGNSFEQSYPAEPMWKVALAIIATPLDLGPVKFSGDSGESFTCIASSLAGLSNPSFAALKEAQEYFLPNSVYALLNIGCGGVSHTNLPASMSHFLPVVRGMALTKMIIRQVNDSERVAAQVKHMLQENTNSGFYFPFLGSPAVVSSFYDWSQRTRDRNIKLTKEYLERADIVGDVPMAARKLVRLQDLSRYQQNQARRAKVIIPSSRPWLEEFKKTLDVVSPDRIGNATKPVRLAILDTGIDAKHPWICKHWTHEPASPRFFDFTDSQTSEYASPIDTAGHGTQMAGIVLQIVPYIDVFVLRVFENRVFDGIEGDNAMERVKKAILFAANDLKVNIISMSFAFEGPVRHDLDSAISEAMERNVVMFAAASNSGDRAENPYPARDRRVFRVNAVDEYGIGFKCNPKAGIDANNDNLAILGDDLLCPWPSERSGGNEESGREGLWKMSSGTSTATALMSAVCALAMSFGRFLRGREGIHARKEAREVWKFVDRPQGMRQLLWRMSGGRNHRTVNNFSNVYPWNLITTDKMEDAEDYSEITKLYYDALVLGREGMS